MRHVIKLVLLLLALFNVTTFRAQILDNKELLNDYFAAHIKSLDEFFRRFSLEEVTPGLENATAERRILSLFDLKMSHEGASDSQFREDLREFVSCIEKQRAHVDIHSSLINVYAQTRIKCNGKNASVTIRMKNEPLDSVRNRWSIAGVEGLEKAGILDTNHYYAISPVDHELHFISLSDLFELRREDMLAFRSMDAPIDPLTFFLTMGMVGKISVDHVEREFVECRAINGYIFTVEEQNRFDKNSGWLITSFKKIQEK